VRASFPQARRSTLASSRGRIGLNTSGGTGGAAAGCGADEMAGFAAAAAGFGGVAGFGGGLTAVFDVAEGVGTFGGAASVFTGDDPAFGASAGVGAGFGASDFVAGTGFGASCAVTALTALLQEADSFAVFCCRHWKAAIPPGCTPEQCDMKSERQEVRMASRCASVACARAGDTLSVAPRMAANATAACTRYAPLIMSSPMRGELACAENGRPCFRQKHRHIIFAF
jgi:hypothetical protein